MVHPTTGFSRPSGTIWVLGFREPSNELLGYYQLSLRDYEDCVFRTYVIKGVRG